MKYMAVIFIAFALQGCATPRLWVQAVTPTGGIIGYQNYNPASDRGARLLKMIPCRNHRMIWSGLKSSASVPAYYMTNNFIIPVSENVTWAEYHYECLSSPNYQEPYSSQYSNGSSYQTPVVPLQPPREPTHIDQPADPVPMGVEKTDPKSSIGAPPKQTPEQVIASFHPDWKKVLKDPKYASWLAKQDPVVREKALSSSFEDTIQLLDLYKADIAAGKVK